MTAALRCPGCGGSLRDTVAPDALLHICDRCGGVWIDNLASQRVVEAALSRAALDHVNAAANTALGGRTGGAYRAGSSPSGTRRCPVCGEVLSRALVAGACTELDLCESHGTFFDREELLRVHDAFASQKARAVRAHTRRATSASSARRSRAKFPQ